MIVTNRWTLPFGSDLKMKWKKRDGIKRSKNKSEFFADPIFLWISGLDQATSIKMFQRVKPEGGTKIRTLRGQRNEEGNSIKLTELYGCTNGSTLLRRLRAVHRRHTNLIPVPDNRTHAERGRIFWPRSRFFDIFLSSTYFRWGRNTRFSANTWM